MRVINKKIIKHHGDLKRGNFAGKPKLYGTSKQKEKTYARETETEKEKRKKFQWTEEMVEYLLDSLRRYKVMYVSDLYDTFYYNNQKSNK